MVQLGKYQLVAEIARGGMGIVYLAVAQGPARFSKLLVIKELKPEFVEDETFLEMFLEEARLAARLSHPNIVQTYEVGEENRRHYIVMDYLDGVTLARVLRRKSPSFTRNMQLRVICEILAGLHYAHTLQDFDGTALGIVHRDVTPQNVFITFDGTSKIVDFGIAKALDSSIETRTGILKGKPAYMAPEQIAGDVDPRADVFSAGVMIWEAVAGQRMWSKKGDVEVLAAMIKGNVPAIREQAPDVPEELAQIIDKALARERDERYLSAAALQDALESYLMTDPMATMREVGKVISEIFAAERTTTRATIDAHLARLKAGAGTEKLPSLLPPPADMRTPTGFPSRDQSPASQGGGTPAGAAISMTGPMMIPDLSVPPGTMRANRRMPFIIGAIAVVLTLIGFLIGMSSRRRDTTASLSPSSAEPTTPTGAPTPEPSPTPVPNPVPVPVATPAPTPTATTEKPPKPPSPSPRPVWTPPPKTAAPPPPAPKPVPPPSAPPPAAADPDTGKMGFLTIDTYPWTRVSSGGKVLGDTPLIHIPLPAGTHVLTLENAGEKVRQTTTVTIKPGETLSRRLAF